MNEIGVTISKRNRLEEGRESYERALFLYDMISERVAGSVQEYLLSHKGLPKAGTVVFLEGPGIMQSTITVVIYPSLLQNAPQFTENEVLEMFHSVYNILSELHYSEEPKSVPTMSKMSMSSGIEFSNKYELSVEDDSKDAVFKRLLPVSISLHIVVPTYQGFAIKKISVAGSRTQYNEAVSEEGQQDLPFKGDTSPLV